jgi:hypothetical protein
VLNTLPVIGNIVTGLAILVAIGVLISTRAAGYIPERRGDSTPAS